VDALSNKGELRQAIVAVLGHVDSGKTTLLDYIRKTRVAAREVGAITQHVGCSEVPIDAIEKVAGVLLDRFKLRGKLRLRGLLFIDLPGHEAFTNLRRRGGSLADIAILVIDIIQGVQPQTIESINILKARRTPFVIALNKIDKVPGWKSISGANFLDTYEKQSSTAKQYMDQRLYRIVGELSNLGIDAERYDLVTDFSKQTPIVPTSAVTGEGVADLLVVLLGLSQRFLADRLTLKSREGIGTILEVKEERGTGTVINVLLYDGFIQKGDYLVVGGKDGAFITKVKNILMPRPLDEIRDPRYKFRSVSRAVAASGVKIIAADLDKALAGAPVYAVRTEERAHEVLEMVEKEVKSIVISTDKIGVIVKADTLGTLEALVEQLKKMNVPIRKADIGPVSMGDVTEARAVRETEEVYSCIICFNVDALPGVEEVAAAHGITILKDRIIYQLLEKVEKYLKEARESKLRKITQEIPLPAKIRVLPKYVFRRSKPAIVGVEVLEGRLIPGTPLIHPSGREVGKVHQIQHEGKPLPEARKGDRVAVSIIGATVGRNLREGDILYSNISFENIQILKSKLKDYLSESEIKLLNEIQAMKIRLITRGEL